MSRDEARILYYALAVLSGLAVVGIRRFELLGWIGLLAAGIVAAIIRNRWLHASAWSKTALAWGLVFIATSVPFALLLRVAPFGG